MQAQEQKKIKFSGTVISVQPRSNVWRYRLDNRNHRTTGYNIFIRGNAEGKEPDSEFVVAISENNQKKVHFRIGDEITGTAWTKKYDKLEYADYYRAGALKKISESNAKKCSKAPWTDEVPELSVYDQRGCRMLDARTWKSKCFTCKWANMANVAIEYDWGVSQRFRFETFCYGPKNCVFYKMGKPRAVPYKGDDSSYDDGCLDEMLTYGRDDEE